MKTINGSRTQNMCVYRVSGDPRIAMAHSPHLPPDAAKREAEMQHDAPRSPR